MVATSNVQIELDKLQFFAKGKDVSSADGVYDNNGSKVPEAFIYEGTTYVPIRKAADLLEEPVYWDGESSRLGSHT